MRATLAVILGSSLLVACGGGGGGGTTPPPQASLLAINATNQDVVGRATATAGTSLVGVTGGVTANTSNASAPTASVAAAGQGSSSITSLARHIAHALTDANSGRRKVLAAGAPMPSATPLTSPPETTPCSVSGYITVGLVDADNNIIPSIGDTMTLGFSQCRETSIETINGSMAITLSRFDFTSQLLSFAGSLSVQQLTIVQGTRTSALNGAISMTYTDRSPTETQILLTIGAAGMTTTVSGSSYSDTVSFEADFTLNQVETIGNPSFRSVSLSGGFSASSIGGRVVFETPVPILQLANEAYPRSGTMRVVGNGSALRMQALDATTIRFELDANLDGSYEASKDVAWTTLLPG